MTEKEIADEMFGMRHEDIVNKLYEAALRSRRICLLPRSERENWLGEMKLAVSILQKYIKIRDIQIMTYDEGKYYDAKANNSDGSKADS